MNELTQSQTAEPIVFLMIDSALHIAGKTGLSPTVTISKNGGGFTTPIGAVTEISNGWYKIAGNATDTDTLGPLIIHAEASGADPIDDRYQVVVQNRRVASMGLVLAKTTNLTGLNDIAATAIVTSGPITTNNGAVSNVTTVNSVTSSIGPGSETVTFTVNKTGIPVDNAAVWITTDITGTNVIAGTLYTNASGVVTFLLDTGSYYVWTSESDVNFTNPTAITVT